MSVTEGKEIKDDAIDVMGILATRPSATRNTTLQREEWIHAQLTVHEDVRVFAEQLTVYDVGESSRSDHKLAVYTFEGIRCEFPREERRLLLTLEKGDKINVQGRLTNVLPVHLGRGEPHDLPWVELEISVTHASLPTPPIRLPQPDLPA